MGPVHPDEQNTGVLIRPLPCVVLLLTHAYWAVGCMLPFYCGGRTQQMLCTVFRARSLRLYFGVHGSTAVLVLGEFSPDPRCKVIQLLFLLLSRLPILLPAQRTASSFKNVGIKGVIVDMGYYEWRPINPAWQQQQAHPSGANALGIQEDTQLAVPAAEGHKLYVHLVQVYLP